MPQAHQVFSSELNATSEERKEAKRIDKCIVACFSSRSSFSPFSFRQLPFNRGKERDTEREYRATCFHVHRNAFSPFPITWLRKYRVALCRIWFFERGLCTFLFFPTLAPFSFSRNFEGCSRINVFPVIFRESDRWTRRKGCCWTIRAGVVGGKFDGNSSVLMILALLV